MDLERAIDRSEDLIQIVEVVAGYVLVFLFAVGVLDLGLLIVESVLSGQITDPEAIIDLIDKTLLLFIVVEIYQTVVAYTRESGTRQVVTIVIYTGVIAMVRKAIIFRTTDYPSAQDALTAALAYGTILLGLGVVLYVARDQPERS